MAANYAVGAALLLLVDVLWTSSNYLSSSVLCVGGGTGADAELMDTISPLP